MTEMWHVIIDFIARPNLTDDEMETALDTISEFYYWHDATHETPTTAIFYIDAPTADEASLRGRGLFDQTFTNHEFQIVATETIRHEDAIARYEAGIRSPR
ncbi:hypothetical protein [Trueperella pyogenes]|uniref:hypothetical protein n=1 Tax=Trueperella pyogenes TaxID=1661 RepID=UPI00345CFCA7